MVGRLNLVNPDAAALSKRLDCLVEVTVGAEVEVDANVRVESGFIETSYVYIASTLVDMIEFQRQFEVAVRMMQTADENASRAANLASIS
jgi:flagellar basal-body rod protein FlgF